MLAITGAGRFSIDNLISRKVAPQAERALPALKKAA
jgi:hypothetical protein